MYSYVHIPANLSKPESGTKSLEKWDFWPESGTLLRNLAKIAKITKFVRKKVQKKSQKIGIKLILSKEKAGQCTKNRDCPSKIGTVGKYAYISAIIKLCSCIVGM